MRKLLETPIEGGGTMFMLPAGPGKCEVCAAVHEPQLPHNAQSIFYQMRFQLEHGRSPDWRDALAHCDAEMRALWVAALAEKGVDVEAGQVSPSKVSRARARGDA